MIIIVGKSLSQPPCKNVLIEHVVENSDWIFGCAYAVLSYNNHMFECITIYDYLGISRYCRDFCDKWKTFFMQEFFRITKKLIISNLYFQLIEDV